MLLTGIAITGAGLLLWSSLKLYRLTQNSQQGKSFCGRTSCDDCDSGETSCSPSSTAASETLASGQIQQNIEKKITFLQSRGVETLSVEADLNKLSHSISSDEIHLVLFGDISSGKSSLINALVPTAKVKTSVIGGTTRKVSSYCWENKLTDKKLYFIDLPGLNEINGELESVALQAVNWSHIPVFVCEGDLTETQKNYLQSILRFKKPVIIAINKTDRYNSDEIEQIKARINTHLASSTELFKVVQISSGGQREVIKVLPDGQEIPERNFFAPQLDELYLALEELLKQYSYAELNAIRTQEIYTQLFDDLSKIERIHFKQQADSILDEQIHVMLERLLPKTTVEADRDLYEIHNQLINSLADIYQIKLSSDFRASLQLIIVKQNKHSLASLLTLTNNLIEKNPDLNKIPGNLLYAGAQVVMMLAIGHSMIHLLAAALDSDQLLNDAAVGNFKLFFEAYLAGEVEDSLLRALAEFNTQAV